MWTSVGGVVAGYLASFFFISTTFLVAYVVLGVDRVFRAGSYEPSGLWLALSFGLGFAGATLGGWVCTRVARASRPARALAGFVLFMGLVMAGLTALRATPPPPRPGGVSLAEARRYERQPSWVAFLSPFFGAGGVLLGSRMARPSSEE